MNKAEFTQRCQEIGTCENESERRDLLAQLIEDAGADYDDHAAAVVARDQAQADIEQLQAENKRLFLRIGTKTEPEEDPNKKPPEKRTYKNLFNEKGELK